MGARKADERWGSCAQEVSVRLNVRNEKCQLCFSSSYLSFSLSFSLFPTVPRGRIQPSRMSTMDKETMQDHILNAIDIIKSKRARPDQNRITELVLKTLEPNSASSNFDLKKRIVTELESAVNQGLVIKVRYKEGISYRNPGSTSRGQGRIYPDDSNGNDEEDQQEQQKVGSEKRAAVTSQVTSSDGSGTNGTGIEC